ncbi:MAG: SusD/RagB family nutrient-binding outer membrane lipoprotein, partial [Bacteroidota bacterium]
GVVDHIPRRFTYPEDEYLKNEDNVREAASRLGGDELDTKVWWDKRPGLPYGHPLQDVFPPN